MVAKDHRDRFIGDRRCQNEKERLIHRACLPYAPRSKGILLKSGDYLRLILRDVRDCFYLFNLTTSASKRISSASECPRTGSIILKMSPRISC